MLVKSEHVRWLRRERLTSLLISRQLAEIGSFKARTTRSTQPTKNCVRHARKMGRRTVSGGAKKSKGAGKERRAMPHEAGPLKLNDSIFVS